MITQPPEINEPPLVARPIRSGKLSRYPAETAVSLCRCPSTQRTHVMLCRSSADYKLQRGVARETVAIEPHASEAVASGW